MIAMKEAPFWKTKKLNELSASEWEALCDGCGLCCLQKLEDEESGDIAVTAITCRYLDLSSCRCEDYANRSTMVPDCIPLTPQRVSEFYWLPETCAYRLIAGGQQLPEWHHLVCGDRNAVQQAGVGVSNFCVSEEYVHPQGWQDYILRWIESPN